MADSDQGHDGGKQPTLAYVAGAIGLVLTLGLIGFVGWAAFIRSEDRTPAIAVEAKSVHPAADGYLVEFEARNASSVTASAVKIEATLEVPGSKPIVSDVTLDYVPGHSVGKGGVFLPQNPASGKLTMRAMGYAAP